MRILHADVVLAGEGSAIGDGAVVLDAEGTIVDSGRAADVLPRHAGAPIARIAGALFPGLINAHTHVELSGLRGKVAGGGGFVPWVERFMGLRAGEQPDENLDAIERGVRELDQAGVTAVGDVTNTLGAVRALGRAGIGGIAFHELLGLDRAAALSRVDKARHELEENLASFASPDLAYAPAPHTLYTTHPDAVRASLALARERGVRSSLHLAEHPAERAFLTNGDGPFAEFARRKGFAVDSFPIPGQSPVEYAAKIGALANDVLAVHLTDARPEELDIVARSGAPVVVCPRSNLFIEVRLPPVPRMLEAGIVPALGTDSLASNLSLDPLAEARAIGDRFASLSTSLLFEMATAAGARALGRPDLGRIAKGARPGLLSCDGEMTKIADPFRWIFSRPVSERRWVVRRTAAGAAPSDTVAQILKAPQKT